MSVKVTDRVWEMSRAKGAARLVLLALADWADDEGYCYPSLTAIVRKTQLTRPGVVQILRRLEDAGEIEITTRGHDTRDKVKAKHVANGGWQPTNYYRVNVGNAVYYPRKRTVGNGIDQPVGNAVDHQVVNAVSEGSKPHSVQVVNADDLFDPASLNDPSVDPSKDPSGGEHAAAPRLASAAELRDHWNELREPGPKVLELTPQRERVYSRALADRPLRADWTDAIRWLNRERWANAPGGTSDHATWRASLDWLTKPGQLAKVLDNARADATAPRKGNRFDPPTQQLTETERTSLGDQRRRRREFEDTQEALRREAAELVLTLSESARQHLEREALVDLEQYRSRMTTAAFDDMVCKTLPHALITRAAGRALVAAVAELEGKGVAA